MHMCMRVCECIFVFMHACINVCTCVYAYMHVYVCIFVCVYVCVYVYRYACAHVCICAEGATGRAVNANERLSHTRTCTSCWKIQLNLSSLTPTPSSPHTHPNTFLTSHSPRHLPHLTLTPTSSKKNRKILVGTPVVRVDVSVRTLADLHIRHPRPLSPTLKRN